MTKCPLASLVKGTLIECGLEKFNLVNLQNHPANLPFRNSPVAFFFRRTKRGPSSEHKFEELAETLALRVFCRKVLLETPELFPLLSFLPVKVLTNLVN